MDSSEQLNLREKLMPFLALTIADLEALIKSKIVLGWIIASLFLGMLRILDPNIVGASLKITMILSDFISLWSLVIIGLTAGAVSSESGELADSILSKAVKRYEYILAKFCSRAVLVFTIYGSITAVFSSVIMRMGVNSIEVEGLIFSILIVALILVMLTFMGVTFSIILPNTIMSIVALLVVWYAMPIFFSLIEEINFLSSYYLIGVLPRLIQGNWIEKELEMVFGFSLICTAFLAISLFYFSRKDV